MGVIDSVTRLGYFGKVLGNNFLTKVAQIFNRFYGFYSLK